MIGGFRVWGFGVFSGFRGLVSGVFRVWGFRALGVRVRIYLEAAGVLNRLGFLLRASLRFLLGFLSGCIYSLRSTVDDINPALPEGP